MNSIFCYLGHKFVKTTFLLIAFWTFGNMAVASDETEEDEKFNPGETIMHHIADSHEWHLFNLGDTHVTIPLPVILYTENGVDIFMSSKLHHAKKIIHEEHGEQHEMYELTTSKNTYLVSHDKFSIKPEGEEHGEHKAALLYDISITKNVASMFVSVTLLFVVFLSVAKGYKKNKGKAPKGIQSFFEPIIVFVRDDIAKGSIGPKYERFTPFLLSVFFFIWFNNMLGLLPGGANLTGNIAVTMVLAIFTLLITIFSGNKNYWSHIFLPHVPLWLYPIIIPIELVGILTKPFALMIRLFANITAGHIIMLSLFSLIFIFKDIGGAVAPLSVAFALAMNLLELFVALLQAYVFTLLSALYFGAAVEESHH